ncbi:hypothetical protein NMY22_g1689 [Coprinellus aureogranulatus]|nr:hypothetical protein NMY22_g1689 [Coprinellus aureogranulatus]
MDHTLSEYRTATEARVSNDTPKSVRPATPSVATLRPKRKAVAPPDPSLQQPVKSNAGKWKSRGGDAFSDRKRTAGREADCLSSNFFQTRPTRLRWQSSNSSSATIDSCHPHYLDLPQKTSNRLSRTEHRKRNFRSVSFIRAGDLTLLRIPAQQHLRRDEFLSSVYRVAARNRFCIWKLAAIAGLRNRFTAQVSCSPPPHKIIVDSSSRSTSTGSPRIGHLQVFHLILSVLVQNHRRTRTESSIPSTTAMGKLHKRQRKALKSNPYGRAERTASGAESNPPNPALQIPLFIRDQSGYEGYDWIATLYSDYENHRAAYIEALKQGHDGDLFCLLYDLTLCFLNIPQPCPLEELVSWAVKHIGQLKFRDEELAQAMHTRKRYNAKRRSDRRQVVRAHLLYRSPQRFAILLGIAHLGVRRLPKGQEKPPRGHWLAPDEAVLQCHDSYLSYRELADKREKRYPIIQVDSSQLFVIPEELSCCLYDLDTNKLILVVIRNFGGSRFVCSWAGRLARWGATTRRNLRLDDTGHIFQVGFSAGNRKVPAFHLARNWTSNDGPEVHHQQNQELASLFAWAWLRGKALLPAEVTNDIEGFYAENNIPRMDPDWPAPGSDKITMKIPFADVDGEISLPEVDRAPSLGGIASRYAKVVHREYPPNNWAVVWTFRRYGTAMAGGHFHISDYGVQVMQEEDTCISFQPRMWHATQLQNYDPAFELPELPEETHEQSGLVFVVPRRLLKVYQKWKSNSKVSPREKVRCALHELDNPLPDDEEDEAEYA